MNKWEEYKSLRANSPKNDEAVRKFELEELWPITRSAVQKSWKEVKKEYTGNFIRGFIFTVGFSPEPIAGVINAINPEFVCFLHTEESEKIVSKVMDMSKYEIERMKKILVDKDDPSKIYNQLRTAIWHMVVERKIPTDKIAIDPTGGTKIMPFVAGLVGINYDLTLTYVSNKKYDQTLRRPVAGTEYLVIAERLQRKFPIQDYMRAIEMMVTYEFHAGHEFWKENFDKYTNSHQTLHHLLEGLSKWDTFKYEEASTSLQEVQKSMKTYTNTLSMEVDRILTKWINQLQSLPSNRGLRSIDYYYHACRQFKRGNLTVAVIMSYVALEMCTGFVCAKHKIDKDNFQRTAFAQVEKLMNMEKKFSRKVNDGKLGLVETMLVIGGLIDEITSKEIGSTISLTKIRNDIVHRAETISQEDTKKILYNIRDIMTKLMGSDTVDEYGKLMDRDILRTLHQWLIELSWKI